MKYKVKRFCEMNFNTVNFEPINESMPPINAPWYQEMMKKHKIKTTNEKISEVDFTVKPYWFIDVGLQLELKQGILEVQSYTEDSALQEYQKYKSIIDALVPEGTQILFVEVVQPML